MNHHPSHQPSARHDGHGVAITMEKDSEANLRSRKERHAIQRALGFKNIVIYVLVFFILVLCAKINSCYSVGRPNKNPGSLAALAATEPEGEGGDASSPEFWIKMGLIVFLVLIGGVFAGMLRRCCVCLLPSSIALPPSFPSCVGACQCERAYSPKRDQHGSISNLKSLLNKHQTLRIDNWTDGSGRDQLACADGLGYAQGASSCCHRLQALVPWQALGPW